MLVSGGVSCCMDMLLSHSVSETGPQHVNPRAAPPMLSDAQNKRICACLFGASVDKEHHIQFPMPETDQHFLVLVKMTGIGLWSGAAMSSMRRRWGYE